MDIVILHGTLGSPEGNWFPWLKVEMKRKGHKVYVPKLPTPAGQNKEKWCESIREQAPIFNKNTILIGHSCGATFLAHILEVVREPVAKSIFVSIVLDDIGNLEYDSLNKSFVHHEFDWSIIKKSMGHATIFHGNNDPYVPISHPEKLSSKLGVPVTFIKNAGHINLESGYIKFKEILEVINA